MTSTAPSSWEDSTTPEQGRVVKQTPFRQQHSLKTRRAMFEKDFAAQEKRRDAQPDAAWRLPLVIEPRDRRKLPYAATHVRYTLKDTMEMRRLVHHIAAKMAFARDPERQREGGDGALKPRESVYCFVEYQREDAAANAAAAAKGVEPPEPKTQMVMVPTSETLSQIYHDYADRDGFLYLVYDTENTFG